MTSRIRIPIKELLKFYDDPDRTHQGHTTAITSVIGEDLGTGLLIDYYHRRGLEARALGGIVTQGTKKGKRLDRWIVVKHGKHSTYYQVEIKNWGHLQSVDEELNWMQAHLNCVNTRLKDGPKSGMARAL